MNSFDVAAEAVDTGWRIANGSTCELVAVNPQDPEDRWEFVDGFWKNEDGVFQASLPDLT